MRNDLGAWGGESGAEIIPERDLQLVAGLEQRQEGIAAIATGIAAGAAAHLALGDESADVVFGAVGVQRDLRTV